MTHMIPVRVARTAVQWGEIIIKGVTCQQGDRVAFVGLVAALEAPGGCTHNVAEELSCPWLHERFCPAIIR
jgi:hypothetical protein